MHIIYNLHELLADFVSLFHGWGFTIHPDDRLGIGLTQMYPFGGEINLHTVDIVNMGCGVGREHLLHLDEDGVNIGIRSEVDAILGYLIVGELSPQFANLTAFLGKRGKEEGYAYKGITTVMTFGIDDSTVSFATNNSIYFLHLGSHVYFAYG